MKQRPVLFLFSALLLLVGGYFVVREAIETSEGWHAAHTRLMNQSAEPTFTTYLKCTFQQHCRHEYNTMLDTGKAFPMIWFMVGMGGLTGIMILLLYKPKAKLYEGSFATREDVHPLRVANWLRNHRVGNAFLLGHHLEVPDEGDARKAVLRGWDFRSLDKNLMVVRPGYGKRNELPLGAVFGTTRSGKTMHLMTQALRWTGSFIALDVKGEIYQKTAGVCSRRGNVFVLSPDGKGSQFNPIQELLKTDAGISTAANVIAAPHLEKGNGKYFAEKAAQGIAAAFHAANYLNKPPFDFLHELVLEGGMGSFVARIRAIPDEDVRVALNYFLDPHGGEDFDLKRALEEKSLTNAWSTMIKSLAPFLGKEIRWMMRRSDFTARSLLTDRTYVYLQFPETTLEATSKVYDLIVTGLTRAMFDHVAHKLNYEVPKRRVLLLLDELYAAPIYNLAQVYATAAGRHITPIFYCQSPSQLADLYGPNAAEAILDNCGVQLYYKSETPGTAKRVSEIAGKVSRRETRRSHRWQPLGFKAPTISEGNQTREVISPDEVDMVGGENREVILAKVTGLPLILMKRLIPYEIPTLSKLTEKWPAPAVQSATSEALQNLPALKTKRVTAPSDPSAEPITPNHDTTTVKDAPHAEASERDDQAKPEVGESHELPVVPAYASQTAKAIEQVTRSAPNFQVKTYGENAEDGESQPQTDTPSKPNHKSTKGKPSESLPVFE